MTNTGMSHAEQLADFVATTPSSAIPSDVLRANKRHLLDALGAALGARQAEAVAILLGLTSDLGGAAQAGVIGHDLRTSLPNAARLNGVMTHVLDFDDTHIPTILHPSGPALAAVLPLAEARGASGLEALAAFTMGVEAGCRVALALAEAHYAVGWHVTGTAGTLGAAAAAARLLGLNSAATHTALSIAATEAAGHRAQFGTMTKSLHTGNAAANGVFAALLAERGYTASAAGVDGARGLLQVASGAPAPDELSAQLGERWEIGRAGIKPYACGVVMHPGIDAVRQLARRTAAPADEVEAIALSVHPLVLELTGKLRPRTGLEGKFSITFASAITWLEGTARQNQFTDEKVNRADVQALRDRVSATVDGALSHTEARASVRLRDGRSEQVHVAHATGTPENPISDGELHEKFAELVEPQLGSAAAGRIVDLIGKLEQLESLDPLLALLSPRQ